MIKRYLTAFLLIGTSSINAAVVEYAFTGTVNSASGNYSVLNGKNVFGNFLYDTSWPALTNGADTRLFRANSNQYGISVHVNGSSFDSKNNTNSQFNHLIDVVDNRPPSGPLFDEFNYRANRESNTDLTFVIELLSSSANLNAINGLLPPEALDLALFDADAYGEIYSYDPSGSQNGYFQYSLASLTAVPIPSALALFASAIIPFALRLTSQSTRTRKSIRAGV